MNRKVRFGIAGVLMILLLAGAAYLGARMLNQRASGMGLQAVMGPVNGQGGPVRREMRLNVKHAEEIPARKADVLGVVTEMGDNTISVGTDPVMTTSVSEGGEVATDLKINGQVTEVVITSDTQIYIDTTFKNAPDPENMPGEDEEIQQTVEAADSSALEKDSTVLVWGQKRGDRVVAEVILVSKPVIFRAGGN